MEIGDRREAARTLFAMLRVNDIPADWLDAVVDTQQRRQGEAFEVSVVRGALDTFEGLRLFQSSHGSEELSEQREINNAVERLWGEALTCLEMQLQLARRLVPILADRATASGMRDPRPLDIALFIVLSRGVQAGLEILALLRAGYPGGAEARWRTLHELSVVARVLKRDPDGDVRAERYMEHAQVERLALMEAQAEAAAQWGIPAVAEEALKEQKAIVTALCERFGKSFRKSYGWAAGAKLKDGWTSSRAPKLGELQQTVGLQGMLPAYLAANHAIHASFLGFVGHLAHPPNGVPSAIPGPSMTGLGGPLINTAWSVTELAGAVTHHAFGAETTVVLTIALLTDHIAQLQVPGDDERADPR
jgi:hypothetical protein